MRKNPSFLPSKIFTLQMLLSKLSLHSIETPVANSLATILGGGGREGPFSGIQTRNSKRVNEKTELAEPAIHFEEEGEERNEVDRTLEACSKVVLPKDSPGSAQLARSSRDKGATDGFGSRRRISFLSASLIFFIIIFLSSFLSFFLSSFYFCF